MPPRRSTTAAASGTTTAMLGSTASQTGIPPLSKSARSVKIGFLFRAACDEQRYLAIPLPVAELPGGARRDHKCPAHDFQGQPGLAR
jgi:hypothetical protein